MSFYFILSHFISFYFILSHFISFYLILFHFISFDLILSYLISSHLSIIIITIIIMNVIIIIIIRRHGHLLVHPVCHCLSFIMFIIRHCLKFIDAYQSLPMFAHVFIFAFHASSIIKITNFMIIAIIIIIMNSLM